MTSTGRILAWMGVLAFTALVIFLSFNRHSKSGYFNYHSEIWADKAGYYVYLPAAFKFNFDSRQFPDSIQIKTGGGFELLQDQQKVVTKYPYGVALLQAPFFLIADFIAEKNDVGPPGFSPVHHGFVNVAAVFYLVMGLIMLYYFLRPAFSPKVVVSVLFTVFAGTTLFHYSVDETGMSHVYSFALFSAWLLLLHRTEFLKKGNAATFFLFGLVAGLIVVTRPSNILFLSVFIFWNISDPNHLKDRLWRLFNLRIVVPVLLGFLITLIPQMIYWAYAFDSPVSYSYGDEGFNWLQPKLLNIWFSPNNGLFLYTPLFGLTVIALAIMIRQKMKNGLFLLVLFLGISYVVSAWWDWSFGCSYGARNYVEYCSIFSVPLAFLYSRITKGSKRLIIAFFGIIVLLIAFNLKMSYSYDECYYGKDNWDWNYYMELVKSPPK